jgi:hypothetical protein
MGSVSHRPMRKEHDITTRLHDIAIRLSCIPNDVLLSQRCAQRTHRCRPREYCACLRTPIRSDEKQRNQRRWKSDGGGGVRGGRTTSAQNEIPTSKKHVGEEPNRRSGKECMQFRPVTKIREKYRSQRHGTRCRPLYTYLDGSARKAAAASHKSNSLFLS